MPMHRAASPIRAVAAALLATAALSAAACASRRSAEPAWAAERRCEFAVYNRTPHAIDVRMWVRPMAFTWLGSINPGERLSHSAPCAAGSVLLTGIAIPQQVGAWTSFRSVENWAELIEGVRVDVALTWPEPPYRHAAIGGRPIR